MSIFTITKCQYIDDYATDELEKIVSANQASNLVRELLANEVKGTMCVIYMDTKNHALEITKTPIHNIVKNIIKKAYTMPVNSIIIGERGDKPTHIALRKTFDITAITLLDYICIKDFGYLSAKEEELL